MGIGRGIGKGIDRGIGIWRQLLVEPDNKRRRTTASRPKYTALSPTATHRHDLEGSVGALREYVVVGVRLDAADLLTLEPAVGEVTRG